MFLLPHQINGAFLIALKQFRDGITTLLCFPTYSSRVVVLSYLTRIYREPSSDLGDQSV